MLKLTPAGKDYLWGGTRLIQDKTLLEVLNKVEVKKAMYFSLSREPYMPSAAGI